MQILIIIVFIQIGMNFCSLKEFFLKVRLTVHQIRQRISNFILQRILIVYSYFFRKNDLIGWIFLKIRDNLWKHNSEFIVGSSEQVRNDGFEPIILTILRLVQVSGGVAL